MALQPFVIQEVGGRRIVLSGRALPYRPLKFQGTQQLEQTWYPGYDRATVQVLGPHEENTTINGMWKDRFLAQYAVGYYGGIPSPQQSPIMSDESPITTTADAVRVFDEIRRSGLPINVSWGSVARRGYLRSFSHTWTTEQDCEWEMEFLWSSNESTGFEFVQPTQNIPILTTDVSNIVKTVVAQPDPVPIVPGWFDVVRSRIGSVASQVTDINTQFANGVLSIPQASRQMSALLGSTITETNAFLNSLSATGLDVLGVYSSLASTVGSFTAVPTIFQQQWSSIVGGAGVATSSLAVSLSDPSPTDILVNTTTQSVCIQTAKGWVGQLQDMKTQIDAGLNPDPLAYYVVKQGENLRGISNSIYGTPDRWTDIRDANKDKIPSTTTPDSDIAEGTILVLPPRNQNG
jgi:hypothetical protein